MQLRQTVNMTDVDEINETKAQRSKAKHSVTIAARRLTDAAERKADIEILKSLMIDLEKVYEDFCMVNEEFQILVADEENAEYRVVNGEDIETYGMNVQQTYLGARDAYTMAKAANQPTGQWAVEGELPPVSSVPSSSVPFVQAANQPAGQSTVDRAIIPISSVPSSSIPPVQAANQPAGQSTVDGALPPHIFSTKFFSSSCTSCKPACRSVDS